MRHYGFVLIGIFATSACLERPSDPTMFRAGYAEVDITPPVGTFLGGYGVPMAGRRTSGHHDPLLAQVLLIQNDVDDAFMLVTVDASGYFYEMGDWGPGVRELRREIAKALADRVNLQAEHILLTSSHSHAATDIVGFWQEPGEGVPREYLARLLEDITSAAIKAASHLQPAELWFGDTQLVGYTGRDDGCSEVIDNTVEIMQVRGGWGQVLANVVNYAKHPTLQGAGNSETSADFIWGFRSDMLERTGAPAMFVQGFIAAVHGGTEFIPGSNWDRVYAMGEILADKVINHLPALEKGNNFEIAHRSTEYSSKVTGDYMLFTWELLGMPKRTIREQPDGGIVVENLEVSWHAVGEAEFAAMPGEGTPEYGLRLRERMTRPYGFIVGLANDEVGYIIDPESLENDPVGRLEEYELKMGLGAPGGPATWKATESLDWFDGRGFE